MEKSIVNKGPTLHEVKEKFKKWRSTRSNKQEPIPEPLWRSAAELCKAQGISHVSRIQLSRMFCRHVGWYKDICIRWWTTAAFFYCPGYTAKILHPGFYPMSHGILAITDSSATTTRRCCWKVLLKNSVLAAPATRRPIGSVWA